MNKPSKELQEAMEDPGRRLELEREFHQWAKDTGARIDAFNVITWLQDKGLMLSDSKRKILIEMRDEFKRMGWPQTAAKIDEVLKD